SPRCSSSSLPLSSGQKIGHDKLAITAWPCGSVFMKNQILLTLTLLVLAAGSAAAQKTFYNKQFKVGFKYPATMKFTTEPSGATDEGFKDLAEVSIRKPGRGVFDATATVAAGTMTQQTCK